MRTTLLGSLLDVARAQPRPRRRAGGAVRVRPRLPLRDGGGRRAARRATSPASGRRRSHEPHRLGCLAVGPLAAKSWRGGGEPADFFALKGVAGGAGRAARRRSRFEPGGEPFLHPGRAARSLVGGAGGGLVGRDPPARLPAAGTSRPRSASRSTSRRCSRVASRGQRDLRGRDDLPGGPPGPRGRRADRGPGRRVREAVVAGGGELLRSGRGLRPLRGRAARRGAQEPRPAARVPRSGPDPHRRGGGRAARPDRG